MINKRFFEFIYGKVSFSVKNGFEDIFLSYCRLSGAQLFDMKKTENGLEAEVRYGDFDDIMKASEKSGMSLTVKKRYGLPYIFYRYRKRLGIPAGVFIFAVIIRILTLMIWSVDISGNNEISTEELMQCLSANGVKTGVFSDSIQKEDAEFILYSEFEELSWVKLYITGCRVFVDVREREKELAGEDKNMYSNIVAAKDGEVVRADIFSGEGKIYPGTAVVMGDMLVGGVITFTDGSVKFVNSSARVLARTKNKLSVSTALKITAAEPQSYRERKSLYFFGITVPFGKSVKENCFTSDKRYFESADIVFPIGIYTDYTFSLTNTQIELSTAKASLIAFYDFSSASLALYSSAQVLERKIQLSFNSQANIEAEYLCIEDIALEKSFTVNDEGKAEE